MQFDGAETDAEMAGDDFVRLACSHKVEDLPLAFCQKRDTRFQLGALQPLLVRRVMRTQCPFYAVEQRFLTQRFLDKLESARL